MHRVESSECVHAVCWFFFAWLSYRARLGGTLYFCWLSFHARPASAAVLAELPRSAGAVLEGSWCLLSGSEGWSV